MHRCFEIQQCSEGFCEVVCLEQKCCSDCRSMLNRCAPLFPGRSAETTGRFSSLNPDSVRRVYSCERALLPYAARSSCLFSHHWLCFSIPLHLSDAAFEKAVWELKHEANKMRQRRAPERAICCGMYYYSVSGPFPLERRLCFEYLHQGVLQVILHRFFPASLCFFHFLMLKFCP
jgi:hypothetical protein